MEFGHLEGEQHNPILMVINHLRTQESDNRIIPRELTNEWTGWKIRTMIEDSYLLYKTRWFSSFREGITSAGFAYKSFEKNNTGLATNQPRKKPTRSGTFGVCHSCKRFMIVPGSESSDISPPKFHIDIQKEGIFEAGDTFPNHHFWYLYVNQFWYL